MKEKYIEMRNNSSGIEWQFIYDYAVSKGFNLGVEKFNLGAQFLVMEMPRIIEQLDKEFELTILYSKTGEFIKIIT